MAPGPTPVPPEVLAAGAQPVLHHRGPDFRALMLRTLGRLQEVCRTRTTFSSSPPPVRRRSSRPSSTCSRRESASSRSWRASSGAVGGAGAGVRRRRPRAPVRVGGDASRRGRSRPTRRDRRAHRVPRSLGDLHRRRLRRPGARAGRARRRRARRRRRGVEPRGRAARDRRVGTRRRRRRVSEGAHDPARPLHRHGLECGLGALARRSLPRFYLDWERMRASLETGSTPFTPAVTIVAGLDVALGLLLEEGLDAAFARHAAPGARMSRGREGDGPRALLAGRGPLGDRHRDPDPEWRGRARARPGAA